MSDGCNPDGEYGRRNVLKKAGTASLVGLGTLSLAQPASAAADAVEDIRLREQELESCSLWYLPVDHHLLGVDLYLSEEVTAMSRDAIVASISTAIGARVGGWVGGALGFIAGNILSGQIAGELEAHDTVSIAVYDTHAYEYIPGFGYTNIPKVRAGAYYWTNVEGLPDPWDLIDTDDVIAAQDVSDVIEDYTDLDVPFSTEYPLAHTEPMDGYF